VFEETVEVIAQNDEAATDLDGRKSSIPHEYAKTPQRETGIGSGLFETETTGKLRL